MDRGPVAVFPEKTESSGNEEGDGLFCGHGLAYAGQKFIEVFVEFVRYPEKEAEKIIFSISDAGIPFDPTKQPPVDTSLSAEERAIGGLGIHLVNQLMDEVKYERVEGKNVLTLVKTVKSLKV